MKVITNEELVAKKKKQANLVTPFAMVFLLGGLVTNFLSIRNGPTVPIFSIVTIVLLGLGFIAATISSHLVNHWVKEPRPDQVLINALKGFDNKHMLFNYTTGVPHVFLTPNMIYAITPKLTNGEISVNERKWHRKFKLSRFFRFFGEEGLGNPTIEAEHNRDKLVKYLQQHMSDVSQVAIEPMILFTNPNVELDVANSVVPVLTGGKLKKFIRQTEKQGPIDPDQHRALVEALSKNGKAQ
jgi:hypothetical protein